MTLSNFRVILRCMCVSIKIDNKKSTPLPIIVGTLLVGLSTPIVSFFAWRCFFYHLHETNDHINAYLFLIFAVFWPAAWIFAMFVGALNPLFGRTIINITKEHIEIKKYLFSICWKHFVCINDNEAKLSITQKTMQSPTHSHANQMGKGITTCTYWQLILRSRGKQCQIHESYDKNDELELLNNMRQSMMQVLNSSSCHSQNKA